MSIQIASYCGKSWLSDIIRLITYSQYSHSAALFSNDVDVEVNGKSHLIPAGSVIEAWQSGIRMVSSISEQHNPNTKVDVFELKHPMTKEQEQKIARFLILHLGRKYDVRNVCRFLPIVRLFARRPVASDYDRTHWFCSELVFEAFEAAGIQLLERCKPNEVPPRDIPRSPLLYLVKTLYTS